MNDAATTAEKERRLDWLDLLRLLAIAEIVGFHWLRTCQQSGAFNLVSKPGYENVGIGLSQLDYLLIDRSGVSPAAVLNNAIGVVFGYGWEAVNVFVLLSGVGLALSYRPARPGSLLLRWYLHRCRRILLPYYAVALSLILAAEALEAAGRGHAGLLGTLAGKLAAKNLPDPIGIELAKHLVLADPRQPFWIIDFFSPAWWFLPPILVAYLCFPLLWRGVQRCGAGAMLALALPLSAASYTLTSLRLLPEHGPYFVVCHEVCNFVLGIAIGRFMAAAEGRERVRSWLAGPVALPLGAALFIAGNFGNWYSGLYPVSAACFTPGLTLILGAVAVRLARLPPARALARLLDAYHVYLLHQALAFPLVALTAAVFGGAATRIGFSAGFAVYLMSVALAALAFGRIWRGVAVLLARIAATPPPLRRLPARGL